MNNNWYELGDWYEPLEKHTNKKIKGSKNKTVRTVGLIVLILAILSSLAFTTLNNISFSISANGKEYSSEDKLPETFEEYADDFYTTVQSDKVNIGIEVADKQDFTLELKESVDQELSLNELYDKCANSIVAIKAFDDSNAGFHWGTGVAISKDGLIITNSHVIEGTISATVITYDDVEYNAKLVGADSISDIAVLKIEVSDLAAAEFGDSSKLDVGDKVVAIGNPLGATFRMTMTDGIVSAINRGVNYNGHELTLLQTNAALNEGNSGGALFNIYGQVVGITNMKMMSSYSSIEGIGFAIPSVTVKSMVDSIIADGEILGRPSIGITVGAIPQNVASAYDMPNGLYVVKVEEGSDAQKKGIVEGDVVTKVNGIEVSLTSDVNLIKDSLSVGDIITFTIWRNGELSDIEVELMDTKEIYG